MVNLLTFIPYFSCVVNVISKLFIERFYKLNAGFFLALFIALFGIMSGVDTIHFHRAIMQAITGSVSFMLISFVVFAVYNLKCISFTLKELKKPENDFLYQLQTVSNARQLGLLVYCHASLYLPMAIYGLLAAYVGFVSGNPVLASLLALWQMGMCMAGALISFYQLNTTLKFPPISLPSFSIVNTISYNFYLLFHSLYSRKGAIIGIKLISLLLLQFMVVLNDDKPNKENVCFLVLLCISTHALLPVYYVDFTERQLGFMRNMPVTLLRRYMQYMITYSVIFIPELLFMLWNERNVLPLSVIFSLYGLAISRLMLYTSIQYMKHVTLDRYTLLVFVMFFVTLVLLASFNLWLFSGLEFGLSVLLFRWLYYKYEPQMQMKG